MRNYPKLLSRLLRLIFAVGMAWASVVPSQAAILKYNLQPIEVAKGCYAVIGSEEYFSYENGGNIVNTGFIVSDTGVLLIDTGPSLRYGEELRQVIEQISGGKPIERAILTHAHPDHFLGNQAFSDIPIYAGQKTAELIQSDGAAFTLNMYRLNGDWMRGTESTPPSDILLDSEFEMGGHQISLIKNKGHTFEDYAVLDRTCGVLYAGDMVFNSRTLSTPHATLSDWKDSLKKLKDVEFDFMVPGHGAIVDNDAAIVQTLDYLEWLEQLLNQSYETGLDITEVMQLPLPERFANFALAREEFQRSVHNLYPGIEASNLPLVNQH